ncbi:WD40 repeat-like protein [Atractiella rhizophila]|nr:WD40 repeat-like protein [Atractiella rhizophila]
MAEIRRHDEISEDVQEINQQINEEYKVWKKNASSLYDFLVTHALEWPSLTVEWFPDVEIGATTTSHRLLVGTNTSGQEPNYLQIYRLNMERSDADGAEMGFEEYDPEKQELSGTNSQPNKLRLLQSIPHPTEVNRARYMPQNPDLIATKTAALDTLRADVLIYDRTKHPSQPPPEGLSGGGIGAQMRLKGHTREGYGLAWNATSAGEGHLISGGEDATVVHWDIKNYKTSNAALGMDPLGIYKGHTGYVNDVGWHNSQPTVFGSAGDDGKFFIWDYRVPPDAAPLAPKHALPQSNVPFTSLSFSPHTQHHFLVSTAESILLHDLRFLTSSQNFKSLHTFTPTDNVPMFKDATAPAIQSVIWSPTEETVFASSGGDRRVRIWDCAKIGEEQTEEDKEDGPPELVFIHAGHIDVIGDICWCPGFDLPTKGKEKKKNSADRSEGRWTMASVDENNGLHVWQVGRPIWAAGEVELNDMDLE